VGFGEPNRQKWKMREARPRTGELLASFVCGYAEFYKWVPLLSRGGWPWPLSQFDVYRHDVVIHPRGPLAKLRTIHLPLQAISIEKDVPFLWSSRFFYLKLYPNDPGRRVTVTLRADIEPRIRELLSSVGVPIRSKAGAA
jgi:hypothetical protein